MSTTLTIPASLEHAAAAPVTMPERPDPAQIVAVLAGERVEGLSRALVRIAEGVLTLWAMENRGGAGTSIRDRSRHLLAHPDPVRIVGRLLGRASAVPLVVPVDADLFAVSLAGVEATWATLDDLVEAAAARNPVTALAMDATRAARARWLRTVAVLLAGTGTDPVDIHSGALRFGLVDIEAVRAGAREVSAAVADAGGDPSDGRWAAGVLGGLAALDTGVARDAAVRWWDGDPDWDRDLYGLWTRHMDSLVPAGV